MEIFDFFQALIFLIFVRIMVFILPQRKLAQVVIPILKKPVRSAQNFSTNVKKNVKENTVQVFRVTRAVRVVGERLPGKTSCLVQAIAAQMILILRQSPAELCIGIRSKKISDKNQFIAHAWLSWRGQPVLGEVEDLETYRLMESTTSQADTR